MYNLINVKENGELIIDNLYSLEEVIQVISHVYQKYNIRYTRLGSMGSTILTINASKFISPNLFVPLS